MKGLFITFEGIEGCGKSTQVHKLKEHLEARGHRVNLTREPGGTPIGEAIRAVLLAPASAAMADATELLLYQAARAQHVAERIRPALEQGVIVVCDRFADSTTAYQGAGRGLPSDEIERLQGLATANLAPDLTILLDLPVEEGLKRAMNTGEFDRIEREAVDFHRKVRQAFLRLAEKEPQRVRTIDGLLPVDEAAAQIAALVEPLLDARQP